VVNILVVDDHPANREFLTKLLGYTGHHIQEAADGGEALIMVRSVHPDLVNADLLMPEMAGCELVRQIRSDPNIADTHVIFCSAAYHELEARPLAEACGVSEFLPKPADPRRVLKLVESLLSKAAGTNLKQPPADYGVEHRRLLTGKLAQKAAELEAANLRLAALNELGQQLARENNPRRILHHGCDAARELLAAKYALISVMEVDDELPRHFFVAGMWDEQAVTCDPPKAYRGLLEKIALAGQVQQVTGLDGDLGFVGLPARFPPVDSLLGMPIRSASGLRGCLCVFDKLAGSAFTTEDSAAAGTLAAQVSSAYENARRREDLEQEIVRRIQATEDLKAVSTKNEVLEQFASAAAHDLKSPLATVHCNLEFVMQNCLGKIDATTEAAMAAALKGLLRMDQLIHGLLAYARAGGIIERSKVACEELVQECQANLEADIKASGAQIEYEELPTVHADRDRLAQLFQNLIGNAIKYRDRRSNVAPIIHIRAERQPQEWLFSVRDNGIGIAAHHLEEISTCFKRLYGQSEYPGTGIGLATCKKLVESHGGRIWAESTLGNGSTFFFTLPAERQSASD
jgi:signal transduction histidine kinase/CheY-like chemotaxis protein